MFKLVTTGNIQSYFGRLIHEVIWAGRRLSVTLRTQVELLECNSDVFV